MLEPDIFDSSMTEQNPNELEVSVPLQFSLHSPNDEDWFILYAGPIGLLRFTINPIAQIDIEVYFGDVIIVPEVLSEGVFGIQNADGAYLLMVKLKEGVVYLENYMIIMYMDVYPSQGASESSGPLSTELFKIGLSGLGSILMRILVINRLTSGRNRDIFEYVRIIYWTLIFYNYH